MKRLQSLAALAVLLSMWQAGTAQTDDKDKRAQSGFQFLSVVSDARGAALAEAVTGMQTGSSALFFNPAGMANLESRIDLSASLNEWIADITHNAFSLALRPSGGNYGVLGFSFQSVDYGEFYRTRVNKNNDLGYDDLGTFELSAMAIGVGYAKRLTDRFCVGGQMRWVRQDLGESDIPVVSAGLDTTHGTALNRLEPYAFDFGTQFRTGFKSLVFGMSVRNFSKEIKYVQEGFQLPLVFTLGVCMNVMDFFSGMPFEQALWVNVDASHHRDHPEQLKLGMEYRMLNALCLRSGYILGNDEDGFSFGIGIRRFGFGFDYSYSPFGVFDRVQRMTARFAW
ncbi:PorV/PorQ family protein [bacterium]|nr:PorV/PorQ family protein [bacterium]